MWAIREIYTDDSPGRGGAFLGTAIMYAVRGFPFLEAFIAYVQRHSFGPRGAYINYIRWDYIVFENKLSLPMEHNYIVIV